MPPRGAVNLIIPMAHQFELSAFRFTAFESADSSEFVEGCGRHGTDRAQLELRNLSHYSTCSRSRFDNAYEEGCVRGGLRISTELEILPVYREARGVRVRRQLRPVG